MNIHIKDKELAIKLHLLTVSKFKVGSHMYNLNTENSDNDFLSIYIEPELNRNSFMWEHHQLQFKENGIDYNFTTLQSFIRNALTGDATINFEVLFSDELKNDEELNWLYEYRYEFINYNIIKSYLGLAKRDLKYWRKDTKGGGRHDIETHKKLAHFVRGVIFARNLLNDTFTLDLSKSHTFTNTKYDDFVLLHRIKHGVLDYSFDGLVTFFENLMNKLRDILNERLNSGNIVTYMNSIKLKNLDSEVINYVSNQDMSIVGIDYGLLQYETMENGVKYD